MSYHAAGATSDIANIGLTPYQVAGNPVLALIAQINRFANRTITLPITDSCRSGSTRNYLGYVSLGKGNPPLPLVPVIDWKVASAANLIMYDRLNCAPIGMGDPRKLNAVIAANTDEKQIAWATANVSDITTSIAQFADKLGLNPAKVGITTLDPKMKSKFPMMTVLLLGALAVGAVVVSRRYK